MLDIPYENSPPGNLYVTEANTPTVWLLTASLGFVRSIRSQGFCQQRYCIHIAMPTGTSKLHLPIANIGREVTRGEPTKSLTRNTYLDVGRKYCKEVKESNSFGFNYPRCSRLIVCKLGHETQS